MARKLNDAQFFERVKWNPHWKVVLDHARQQVIQPQTDIERRARGLRPWSPQVLEQEMELPAVA